jgi:hypothetical protein
MKISEVVVGMEVKGENMFGLTYIVTGVDGRKVCVEHHTGELVMSGGKWIPEVYAYKVSAKYLTPTSYKITQ